ncbi:DUF3987 domain-containing protein [Halocynthiibacter styelae]|uniref:DUF3987 domain-containing protein n=1 Tax=Halocynthiibacter styelae TaxID=2761955 RepID=UPI001E2B936D|nr:DUF3987 domain-containing protein [Paenihalocynthiibacter styelae]
MQEFRQQCRAWEGEASGLMKGHVGKLPGLAVRVSLVLACLDAAIAGDGMAHEISASHIGRACHYVGEHLRSHAHRAYGSIKPAPEMQGARTIAEIIESEGVGAFKVRDIQNRGRKHLGTTKAVKQALEVLISFDWIREERGNSGGRPSISYTVNPRIAGAI